MTNDDRVLPSWHIFDRLSYFLI